MCLHLHYGGGDCPAGSTTGRYEPAGSRVSPGRFSLHDLLSTYAKELARTHDSAGEMRAAMRRMLDHYLHTGYAAATVLNPQRLLRDLAPPARNVGCEPVADSEAAMAWYDAERAVITRTTQYAADVGLGAYAWQLAWLLGDYLCRRRLWRDWIAVQQIARDAAYRCGDRIGQAHAHHDLGLAYAHLGDVEQAEIELKQSRQLSIEVGDDISTARALKGLGFASEQAGRYDDALRYCQLSLDRHRAAGNRPGQANLLAHVGWYQALSGDHENALTSCTVALELLRDVGNLRGEAATCDSHCRTVSQPSRVQLVRKTRTGSGLPST